MRAAFAVLLLMGWGCDCGTDLRNRPECDINPNAPGCQPAQTTCATGTVTGVVCAPDESTNIAGATVSVSGVCDGKGFTQTTTTDSSGNYTLTLPAGSWTIDIGAGSFSTTVPVKVTANQTQNLGPSSQNCFPPTIPLAVISGSGDQIESLLTQVGFTPTIIDGSETGWTSGGLAFLENLSEMEKYKVIFIDCGAGRTTQSGSYAEFFFASDQSQITSNLQAFVKNGGSVYASDWAMIFVWMGYPNEFQWDTDDGAITFPFDPYSLMGGPNQTVTGTVIDSGLLSYLQSSGAISQNATTVTITFPSNMDHWGFLKAVNSPADVLINASVGECSCPSGGCTSSNPGCKTAAAPQNDVPLAALYHTTSGSGGVVAYTSFHNIEQQDPGEIEGILKYLIFKL